MKFAIVSTEGSSLSFWARLRDEGEDVRVLLPAHRNGKPHAGRRVGDGLVEKARSWDDLLAWGESTRPGQPKALFVFDGSGLGEKADMIRKRGNLVMGGSSFCDDLEGKRDWSEGVARALGMKMPATKEFASVGATIAWLKTQPPDASWYFKTNKYLDASTTQGGDSDDLVPYLEALRVKWGDGLANIVQEKIEGVALSTACWWNGTTFVPPFEGTIEHKKVMNDDIGPATGCAFNLVWFYEEALPKIAQKLRWGALDRFFREKGASPGIYDINAVVSDDGEAYFLEFTPRMGYDAEPTAQQLLTRPLGDFWWSLCTGRLEQAPFRTDAAAYSLRIGVPPYPFEAIEDVAIKRTAVGRPIGGLDAFASGSLWAGSFIGYGVGLDARGELVVADPGGLVGLAAAVGTDVRSLGKEAVEIASDDLILKDAMFRTDGHERIIDDLGKMKAAGYGSNSVITAKERRK